MAGLPAWRRYLRFFGRDIKGDVDDELKFHLAAKSADLVDDGVPTAEAQAEAMRKFGNVGEVRELCLQIEKERFRKMDWHALLSDWRQDIRHAGRRLRGSPAFSLTAVAILALGIGANSAIFSVFRTVLLKSLPYRDPDRLCWVWVTNPRQGFDRDFTSVPRLEDWKRESTTFESFTGFTGNTLVMISGDDSQELRGAAVQSNFFEVIGSKPLLGRTFHADEGDAGGGEVVVLSHGLWLSRFGADQNILGKTLVTDSRPYQIIGVAPAQMNFPTGETQYWIPLVLTPQDRAARGAYWLKAVGRLKPGVTERMAQHDMSALAKRLERRHQEDRDLGVLVTNLKDELTRDIRPALLMLMSAALCVFLIASANVSSMVMARSAHRQREVAVRAALGASRLRLVRQLVTETVALFVVGGAVALAIAQLGIGLLKKLSPPDLAALKDASLDYSLVFFTLGASLVAGVIFGLHPALVSARTDLARAFNGGTRLTGGTTLGHLRRALVTLQIALSVALLMGGGLLIRSFQKLQDVALGFNPKDVITARIALPRSRYQADQQEANLYESVITRLNSAPGVQGAGAASSIFLGPLPLSAGFTIEGHTEVTPMPLTIDSVTPSFFQAMGIALIRGRGFNDLDRAGSPPVAIINEAAARRHWPNVDPIGKRFKFGSPDSNNAPWLTIVGVVADTRRAGLESSAMTESYQPMTQRPRNSMTLVVRGRPRESLPSIIRASLRSVDAQVPIASVADLETTLDLMTAPRRFNTVLLGLFAVTALILAGVGLYGILANFVAMRQGEIGIRLAVGADRGHVIGMVAKYGLSVLAVGLPLGLAAALASARLISGMLFGIQTWDPLTLTIVIAVIAMGTIGALLVPALRASNVDPVIALRCD